jgi:hypothetical protein
MIKASKELIAMGLCPDEVKEAVALFGDPIPITRENAHQAVDKKLNVQYLAVLLPRHTGVDSFVHFAYVCARRVLHLAKDKRLRECLGDVRDLVFDIDSNISYGVVEHLAMRRASAAAGRVYKLPIDNYVSALARASACKAIAAACKAAARGVNNDEAGAFEAAEAGAFEAAYAARDAANAVAGAAQAVNYSPGRYGDAYWVERHWQIDRLMDMLEGKGGGKK